MLLGALGACAPLRHEGPPSVALAPRAPLLPSAPPAAKRGLGSLQHPRIDVWEERLHEDTEFRRHTEDSLARGTRYLPGLRRIFEENGLPPSLALLPVIESGFWPTARGHSGERGLWQLRRATARRFGLEVSARRDDRLEPERSTRAAAHYLRLLRDRYGDWALALAAYNAGERRVDRALAREPNATFWQLAERGYLPRTSREYVPRFLAVVRMAGEAEPTAIGSAL
jgi:membrane-bound lytic murein transglycosylase D